MTKAFIEELTRFAGPGGAPLLMPVIERLRRPVCVAVVGRRGVGRGCVETALRLRDVAVAPPDGCDVRVHVIAETAKAEDLARVRSSDSPVLLVLTKADLAGAGPGGPIAVAGRRAAVIRATTAIPTVSTVGLLAALAPDALDDELVAALRAFVGEPPDLTSVDAFVDGAHPVARDVRGRLLGTLDRFGIAHAILALAGGVEPDGLAAQLARIGNVEAVMAALDAVSAPVRYRRLRVVIAELRSLAVQSADRELSELLAADVTAMALMATAVDVVEAEGLRVGRGDTAAAHLDRAVRWRRYGRGPVNALHRRCSGDITRGSLRLLGGLSG